MIKVFDVDPKDIALLASDADAKRIVKHVQTDEEEKGKKYYDDAKDEAQKKAWLSNPD